MSGRAGGLQVARERAVELRADHVLVEQRAVLEVFAPKRHAVEKALLEERGVGGDTAPRSASSAADGHLLAFGASSVAQPCGGRRA